MSERAVPCVKCGRPGTLVEVVRDGRSVVDHFSCDACLDEALVGLEALRAQFQALLDAGVSRERANQILCARIDGEAAS